MLSWKVRGLRGSVCATRRGRGGGVKAHGATDQRGATVSVREIQSPSERFIMRRLPQYGKHMKLLLCGVWAARA